MTTKQQVIEFLDRMELESEDQEDVGMAFDYVLYTAKQQFHKIRKKPKND